MKSRFLHTVCIFTTCGILGRLCFLVCGWLSTWWPNWLWCMGDVGGFWRTECFVSSNKQFTTIICILSKVIHTCACLSVFNKWITVFFLANFLYNITSVFLITTGYFLNFIFCFIDFVYFLFLEFYLIECELLVEKVGFGENLNLVWNVYRDSSRLGYLGTTFYTLLTVLVFYSTSPDAQREDTHGQRCWWQWATLDTLWSFSAIHHSPRG